MANQKQIIDNVVLTHATTSCVYTYRPSENKLYQTWLDGSGRVFNYKPNTQRGRQLIAMIARKGFAKKV